MKNKILLLTCIAASLLSSCNNVFDELAINPSQPSMTAYFTTPRAVNEATMTMYGYIQTPRTFGASASKTMIIRSDEASSNSDYGKAGMYGPELNSSYYTIMQPFGLMYTTASQACFVLENIDKVSFSDQQQKSAYMGESYFWRAFAHYYLLISYRNVAPILHMPKNASDYIRPVAKSSDVWDYICSDLKSAVEHLPAKGYWKGADLGRITKASAAALLGKAYMYRSGIEAKYGEDKRTFYTEAAEAFNEIIKGTFVVRLTVTSSNGRTASATNNIIINTPARDLAHALFTVADKVNMNAEVPFTDGSVPADGATTTSWEWNFGDKSEIGNIQNPKHIYTVSGNFTVTLKITDSKNNSDTYTKNINVTDPNDLVIVEWRTALNGPTQNTVSPAMSADGQTIYAWADQSATDAYDVALKAYEVATGNVKWSYNVSNALATENAGGGVRAIYSSPSVGPNGDIYIAARDLKNTATARKSFMFAIKSDGTQRWVYPFGIDANFNFETPAIDEAGNIYIGHLSTAPYEIAVISPAGSKVKSIPLTVGVRSGISLSKNGDVYFCSTGANGLYGYKFSDVAQNWQYKDNYTATGGAIAIDQDGTIYNVATGASHQIVSALTVSGTKKWEYKTEGNSTYGGASIGADGTIYVNGGDVVSGKSSAGVYAIKTDGTLKWHFQTDENVSNCVPLVDDRGYIHFITDKATYYVIDNNGTLYGKKSLGTKSVSSPAMNQKGKVSIIAQEGDLSYVFCLETGAKVYADSPWPMKNANPQRTGLQK